ncbi:MAG TPA: hypothetical protein VF483_03615 [Gemmatimonadaceae bacterium]
MNTRTAAVAALLAVALARPVSAQWRPLHFVRDTSFKLRDLGVNRAGRVLPGRDGRMFITQQDFNAEVIEVDSAFHKLPWTFKVDRGPNGDVYYVRDWGWVGDSIWVLDPVFRQVAFIGTAGTLTKSISWPSWIRPAWSDRRKYPLFANVFMWLGAYPDGTLLVQPIQPRHLLDTPGYDPDQQLLVRIDGDGRILKTVARIPAMEGRFELRSGTERQWVNVPNYAKSLWRVSSDGRRIAVVSPIASDSGAFRVTALDENGDTVFTRRYAIQAERLSKAHVDSVLAMQQPFGRYAVEQVRDTVRKLLPAFYTPVASVDVGLDYSVWVAVRRPTTKIEDAEYFVVDAKGEPQGVVTVPRATKFASVALDKLWVIEQDRVKQSTLLIRFVPAGVRGARPSRSGRGGASSPTSPPPG